MAIGAFLKRHRRKLIITAVVLVLLLIIRAMFFGGAKKPEYLTAPVAKGDLQQTVEAVGTVESEKNLDLQFRSTGIVSQINVNEGDHVRPGQVLASLRAGSLGASVSAAAARVRQAQADLQGLQAGNRPEDIAVTQADLDSKKAALQVAQATLATAQSTMEASKSTLEALRSELNVNVSGEISRTSTVVSPQLSKTLQALVSIKATFDNNDLQDAVVKSDPGAYQDLQRQMADARAKVDALSARSLAPVTYDDAMKIYNDVLQTLGDVDNAVGNAYTFVSGLPTTSSLTVENRTAYAGTIATQKNAVDAAVVAVQTEVKALQDLAANQQTRIATQQSTFDSAKGSYDNAKIQIITYQAAIQSAQAQLNLKKAGSRPQDISGAAARLSEAQANYAAAQANYSDALIVSPVGGTVTKVAIKAGEMSPLGAAITVLGDTPYRIEMFVSEIDVPKVHVGQEGTIELDAYRGTHFQLKVGEVDSSVTLKDGVSKYRVKLDFVYPHSELKIGMTGDAAIVTGSRTAALNVPRRAVLESADGKDIVRVLKADGTVEERPVTLGMEAQSGDVEILSGLSEGETVVVLVK
jgi:multidrug efflux pump subunit AcrA (membrane-fusion protein)